MELRHLRYFVAVAEELNFRRAAERLHLSQPSLSRQVRDLEKEIGERLFERDRRRVSLTPAGHALLREARSVVTGTETAIQAAREAGRARRGALRIGSIGVISASFLPGTLARFRERFAAVDVEVLELGLDEQVAALLDGTIGVGFQVRSPGTPADLRFAERAVLTSPLMVVMPTRHHLAGKSTLPLRSLADEEMLHLEPRPGGGYDRWVRALCEEASGFTPKFRHPEIGNIEALFGMVAAGEGLAILPEIVAARSVAAEAGLTAVQLGPPPLPLQVTAVWNPAKPSMVLNRYLSILFEPTVASRKKAASPAMPSASWTPRSSSPRTPARTTSVMPRERRMKSKFVLAKQSSPRLPSTTMSSLAGCISAIISAPQVPLRNAPEDNTPARML